MVLKVLMCVVMCSVHVPVHAPCDIRFAVDLTMTALPQPAGRSALRLRRELTIKYWMDLAGRQLTC